MPEASQDAYKGNQRQPFQNAGRIESPVWVNRHQTDRGEEMPGVPPYGHSGVHEAARKRPDNNLLFTDAAVLKPHRDQAQDNREREKWPGSNDVAPEVVVGFGLGRFFVPPPGAQQQNKR